MSIFISLLLACIFIMLALLHFYWGVGGMWGKLAALPSTEKGDLVINPKIFECVVVGLGLLGFAGLSLQKTNILGFNAYFLNTYGIWLIIGIFSLRALGEFKYVGLFKKIKNTTFGRLDTKFYTPLCLFISFLGLLLELS
jgi:hypothetical protein